MNALQRIVLLIIAVTIVLLCHACKEKPTQPPVNNAADTTTHDFIWTIYPIGIRHTSIQDIVALSDTDVWICGEIWFDSTSKYDPSGQLIKPFNVGHWDGQKWTYTRIYWSECGAFPKIYLPIDGMFANNRSDLWFAIGLVLGNLKDNNFKEWCMPSDGSRGVIHLLSRMNGNLFGIAGKGFLTEFNGTSCWKIETGTIRWMNDIFTRGDKTYIVASNTDSLDLTSDILILNNDVVTKLIDTTLVPQGNSIWVDERGIIYVCGWILQKYENGHWTKLPNLNRSYLMSVRGTAWNDIFVVGHYGSVMHYNGATWKFLSDVEPTRDIVFFKVAYVKNNVFTFGYDSGGKFYVYHGRRR